MLAVSSVIGKNEAVVKTKRNQKRESLLRRHNTLLVASVPSLVQECG